MHRCTWSQSPGQTPRHEAHHGVSQGLQVPREALEGFQSLGPSWAPARSTTCMHRCLWGPRLARVHSHGHHGLGLGIQEPGEASRGFRKQCLCPSFRPDMKQAHHGPGPGFQEPREALGHFQKPGLGPGLGSDRKHHLCAQTHVEPKSEAQAGSHRPTMAWA